VILCLPVFRHLPGATNTSGVSGSCDVLGCTSFQDHVPSRFRHSLRTREQQRVILSSEIPSEKGFWQYCTQWESPAQQFEPTETKTETRVHRGEGR
jgi:hypothetical protein